MRHNNFLFKLMVLLLFRAKIIWIFFLIQLLLLSWDSLAIASSDSNQSSHVQLISSSQKQDSAAKSRLDQSLELINEMDESQHKINLLNNHALSYAELGYLDIANKILEQCLAIARGFEDLELKVTSLTNIAKSYDQIDQKSQAFEILNDVVELATTVIDKSLQGQLLFEISLKYDEIGQEELAQTLLTQSQTVIAASNQPPTEFPFSATPPTFSLGVVGNLHSFRDTAALLGFNFDYSQQWTENDLFVDSSLSLDYDSSRSVNQLRPITYVVSVYRRHLNAKWNFFTEFFNSTNQDLYSSKNDDEDLTIITGVYAGGGLNLWRGDSPSNFLDFQLGFGPRYEFDYIDFKRRRNQVDPTLIFGFLGRNVPLGKVKLNQTFAILPSLSSLENFFIVSDSDLSIPLSAKWSFSNRLFMRYRNEKIFDNNPNLEFVFSTGVDYQF